MKYLLMFCFFFSSFSYSGTVESEFFQTGLISSEKLTHFLLSHPCELGMDPTCERPFSAKDLRQLKQYFLGLEEWRRIAFDGIAPMGQLKFDNEPEVVIGSSFKLERAKKLKVTLGKDHLSEKFVNEAQISSANMIFLYESFFKLSEIIGKSRKLRAILERDLPGELPVLETTYRLALNEALWNKTRYSVIFLEKLKSLRISFPVTDSIEIFHHFLDKSFIYQTLKNNDLDFRVKKVLFLAGEISTGKFFDHVYKLVGFISKLFGNTAGMFQSRDGKLKKLIVDSRAMSDLRKSLKPLSILLEKTPQRLTDHFIPGYFGHVAIWIGNMGEISHYKVNYQNKLIPLIHHPVVKPHLEKLKEGKLVLEALRLPGVTLNTLENFMDIDDLVIMNPPELSDEETAAHLLRAFSQIDKPYDFNFNVESEVEIVCSELIYTIFTNESWPVSNSLGRFTISPDHVASKAQGIFTPKVMFLSGKKIENDLDIALLKVLGLPSNTNHFP